MANNRLRLNSDKTYFKAANLLVSSIQLSLIIASHPPHTNRGVTFNSNFCFINLISLTCRCCFCHIHGLRRIRRYISLSVAKTIATAFVATRLITSTLFFIISHLMMLQDFTVFRTALLWLLHGLIGFLICAFPEFTSLTPCSISHHFQTL